MKRAIPAVLLSLVLSFCAVAQNVDTSIFSQFKGNRVNLEYAYLIPGTPDIEVYGTAIVQRDCFRIEGAGLLILCDAQSVWTLDLEGKEAYVEAAGPMDYLNYLLDASWEGDDIIGSINEPASGSIISFRLSSISMSPISGDLSAFVPAPDVFTGDWIITDLR